MFESETSFLPLFQGDYTKAMEQLDSAVTIQEKLCDVPHEKLKSLQEKREIYSCLNLTRLKRSGATKEVGTVSGGDDSREKGQ